MDGPPESMPASSSIRAEAGQSNGASGDNIEEGDMNGAELLHVSGSAANDRASGSKSSKIIETTTTVTRTSTIASEIAAAAAPAAQKENVAVVEQMGRRASDSFFEESSEDHLEEQEVDGNRLVTTVSTIGAQCGQSRLVLALLKDGADKLQMKVQEMRPPIFEVGFNRNECTKYREEHRRMVTSLRRQEKAPIEAWLKKYEKLRANEKTKMSTERQLVYMCMLENLQACWKASLRQLDKKAHLLELACNFYELAERVACALEAAENHVQTFRLEFLNGPNSKGFSEARSELRSLNKTVLEAYDQAKRKQQQLIELIRVIASGNLGDARVNHLLGDAQNLTNYISAYLEPLDKRRLQLESVLKTSTPSETTRKQSLGSTWSQRQTSIYSSSMTEQQRNGKPTIREISNFNDLHFVDNWLSLKMEQLNSSLLSSLGVGVLDSRTILNKHEQILLECRAIEEATLMFRGKNIHAIRSVDEDAKRDESSKLFEKQKNLSAKAQDVITILEARISLLRRTIDFHVRSKEATSDIGKMMRRLQVDNSLQSVEFVANELELKDVSSVVASGATIISELQQLQLAQQHGQRSKLVNLSLVTSGIRTAIDQLNQELAHLKTVLNQRKLVLLNEDVNKMAQNFNQKCQQLHFWLQSHVKSFLLESDRVPTDLEAARHFCQTHQALRVEVQRKTLEVEALLKSLASLTDENFAASSAKSGNKLAENIHRSVDELRQDWILVTNCLERRTELAKKFVSLLGSASAVDRELQSLESFQRGSQQNVDRSEDEIKANIEQLFQLLTKQLQQLRSDLQKGGSELRCKERAGGESVNELNKSQMIEHAESLYGKLAARKRSLFENHRAHIITKQQMKEVHQQQYQQQQQQVKEVQASKSPPKQEAQKVTAEKPPRFVLILADKWAPPFSPVELICEVDEESSDYQFEWLMNNFRKIPASIRHSASREGNKHKLTIHSFGPQCCGTYLARVWNGAGQAVSRCELRLAGMNPSRTATTTATATTTEQYTKNDSSLLAHRWPPPPKTSSSTRHQAADKQAPNAERQAMARIVQGVDSFATNPKEYKTTTTTTTMTTRETTTTRQEDEATSSKLPVTESTYSGGTSHESLRQQNQQRQNKSANSITRQWLHVTDASYGSPASSTTLSRSVSRSPFDGTPVPPKFVQPICRSSSPCCSHAGLLCVVVGNPPPTIEWLHNNEIIAVAKCPPRPGSRTQSAGTPRPGSAASKANVCKLTIETVNEQTSGEYTCRASNRMGQTTSNFTLAK